MRGLLIPVAGAAGIAIPFGYAWYRTGDPLIWFSAQRQWNQRLDFGTELIARFGKAVLGTEPDRVHYLVILASLLVWLGLLVWAARSYRVSPLPALAYTGVTIALALLYSSVGPRPRMLQAAFPVFVALGASAIATRPVILKWGALAALLCMSGIYAFFIMHVPAHVTA
ncbi:hypothetical protein [Pseudoclavibacter sp. VKM Ac-2867]|uniref:hypothetical protein n=1 Tax=Pseudoclavibacter sp. VKM Ac-2867 TaxID=2783829 RepID=UPI00188AFAA7|nr:hypothetical protein [Pseudoclavibacter sp. VKM Ac-2867]MBF4459495.1 hypothetical protein [Pseudoclavibacter sp. VKM Ac-2867]